MNETSKQKAMAIQQLVEDDPKRVADIIKDILSKTPMSNEKE